jgi:hypothetical protein
MSDPTAAPPPRRKRGAPKGNTNALKHGAYARPALWLDLISRQLGDNTSLQTEITLNRLILRRILALMTDSTTHPEALRLLSTAVHTAGRIQRAFVARSYSQRLLQHPDFRRILVELLKTTKPPSPE